MLAAEIGKTFFLVRGKSSHDPDFIYVVFHVQGQYFAFSA
jgi:hypothetical protein